MHGLIPAFDRVVGLIQSKAIADYVAHSLRECGALCIGERHDTTEIPDLLVSLLPLLKQEGVNRIYVEALSPENQDVCDRFFERPDEDSLWSLIKVYKSGKTDAATVATMQFLVASQKHGIRHIGIDGFRPGFDKDGVEIRAIESRIMNEEVTDEEADALMDDYNRRYNLDPDGLTNCGREWMDVIKRDQQSDPCPIVVFGGAAHMQVLRRVHAYETMQDLLDCPVLNVSVRDVHKLGRYVRSHPHGFMQITLPRKGSDSLSNLNPGPEVNRDARVKALRSAAKAAL